MFYSLILRFEQKSDGNITGQIYLNLFELIFHFRGFSIPKFMITINHNSSGFGCIQILAKVLKISKDKKPQIFFRKFKSLRIKSQKSAAYKFINFLNINCDILKSFKTFKIFVNLEPKKLFFSYQLSRSPPEIKDLISWLDYSPKKKSKQKQKKRFYQKCSTYSVKHFLAANTEP